MSNYTAEEIAAFRKKDHMSARQSGLKNAVELLTTRAELENNPDLIKWENVQKFSEVIVKYIRGE